MLNLFILLIERVGLIIILAYILMNIPYFKKMMNERESFRAQWQLTVIFGCFALVSNITGVEIKGNHILSDFLYQHLNPDASMANTRVLSISVAGLIGGPVVGVIVAIISGLFRVYIGGADAYTYLISSIIIGLLSGYFGAQSRRNRRYPTVLKGAVIGAICEVIQMLCILIFSEDISAAWELVRFIALPMICVNSLGAAIFLSIILSTLKQEEQARAVQTHDVLQLANATLPYFREGLNEQSAKEAATIIRDLMHVSAVAITNRHDILTHIGAGSDHHKPQKAIITHLSKEAIRTGRMKEAHSKAEIGCDHETCPLEGAIVVPLYMHHAVVGTLKLYFTEGNTITHADKQLAAGLANIFSSQLELGHAEMQSALLRDAEIKSLQAQVNPHFFFNAINTISALIRINSEKARKLLLQLSQFFRSNLQGARDNIITLEQELRQVEAFLSLEQARHPDRFEVTFDIDESCEQAQVPPFVIQILVENAIKHAFKHRKTNNHIKVVAHHENQKLYLGVTDNGHGIPESQLGQLGQSVVPSESGTGSALVNLNRRLIGLFGQDAHLYFHSTTEGTRIDCTLPYHQLKEEH